ncbi:MAG: DUF6198 family protein [Clostridiales bacterium]|jgi:uncharacterized membrane protein YczE|nr:DUF6198 family protein [Clostridiales bacterium]
MAKTPNTDVNISAAKLRAANTSAPSLSGAGAVHSSARLPSENAIPNLTYSRGENIIPELTYSRSGQIISELSRGSVNLPPLQSHYFGAYTHEGALKISAPAQKPEPKSFTLIKNKPVIYNELAILFALFILAIGKVLMMKSNFGVTAVQSIPLLLSMYFQGVSLGTWNLIVQGVYVLIAVALSHKLKLRYIFAIGISLLYVFILDFCVDLADKYIIVDSMNARIAYFAVGYFLSAFAMTFFFRGHMPLMPFETLEEELAAKRATSVLFIKVFLDIVFFAFSVGLSYLLFGEIRVEAIGVGTVIIMLTMSLAIAAITFMLNIFFNFRSIFIKTKNP